jgi:hypothetical protein
MNIAYSEEMRPPKELFSREWYKAWDAADPWEHRTRRIDETKKKLEDLETKLRKKIWKSGGYTQDLLVDTVTFLNSYIGVWQSTKLDTPSNLPHYITMVYPRDVSPPNELLKWEEVVLGGVQRKGVCVVMLSPQCVEWLNEISQWVGE